MCESTDWRELIPHRGAMSLLHEIVAYDATTIHATAVSHQQMSNPLRSDGRLRAVHLCEYGAQAMAVHGGLLARDAGLDAMPGLLVALRAVQLNVVRIDDLPDELHVYATRLLDGGSSWQYAFRVEHAARVVASGRAAVMRR